MFPFIACAAMLAAVLQPAYREAVPGYQYSFPRDHFEHPEFRTEWWYYTGNVRTTEGRRFGFELVFFRHAERLGARDNVSSWRVDDIYLAHAALTDIDGKRFLWRERVNRAGPGIAGASFASQRVWNGNWSVNWKDDAQSLRALTNAFSLDLRAIPTKPFVIHGEDGVSRKGEGNAGASHYVSFPRLAITGSIAVEGKALGVTGQAWMDHEWFTHQLGPGQAGWDWFSVQLEDGTELMLFDLRDRSGRSGAFSSGTYIDKQGRSTHLTARDFTLRPTEFWKSEKTGARYPIAWSISVPGHSIKMDCRAVLADQELASKYGAKYWEGAVTYSGSKRGVGYLEMTGYAGAVPLRD